MNDAPENVDNTPGPMNAARLLVTGALISQVSQEKVELYLHSLCEVWEFRPGSLSDAKEWAAHLGERVTVTVTLKADDSSEPTKEPRWEEQAQRAYESARRVLLACDPEADSYPAWVDLGALQRGRLLAVARFVSELKP